LANPSPGGESATNHMTNVTNTNDICGDFQVQQRATTANRGHGMGTATNKDLPVPVPLQSLAPSSTLPSAPDSHAVPCVVDMWPAPGSLTPNVARMPQQDDVCPTPTPTSAATRLPTSALTDVCHAPTSSVPSAA
jgi:hypothetical protein